MIIIIVGTIFLVPSLTMVTMNWCFSRNLEEIRPLSTSKLLQLEQLAAVPMRTRIWNYRARVVPFLVSNLLVLAMYKELVAHTTRAAAQAKQMRFQLSKTPALAKNRVQFLHRKARLARLTAPTA